MQDNKIKKATRSEKSVYITQEVINIVTVEEVLFLSVI